MNTKFTDGPWRVGDREPYVEVWGPMRMNSYPIVASLECEPREANARLIAAAPDMFEALDELAALFEKMAALHPSRDLREVLPDPAGLAVRTRAALSKAQVQS